MQRTLKTDLQDPKFLSGAVAGAFVLVVLGKIFRKKS
jgi:hypothetical protein